MVDGLTVPKNRDNALIARGKSRSFTTSLVRGHRSIFLFSQRRKLSRMQVKYAKMQVNHQILQVNPTKLQVTTQCDVLMIE